ncbi:Apoptotic chromatin condensation inducer in the nucleus [Actinomortierella wolfii]|nr:Apoptotic chromatin condensation inducer in the nucleus [Actinomortierella wolfii]
MDPNSLKVTELRNELSARGLSTKGVKKELVARLEEALAAEGDNASSSSPDKDEKSSDTPMEQDPPSTTTTTKEDTDTTTKDSEDIAKVAPPIEEDNNTPAEESIVSAPAPIPADALDTTLSALAPVVGTPTLSQEGLVDTTATAASTTVEKPSASAPTEQVEEEEAAPSGQKRSISETKDVAEDESNEQQQQQPKKEQEGDREEDDGRSAKRARHEALDSNQTQSARSDAPTLSSESSQTNASPDDDRRGSRRIDARTIMARQVEQAAKDREATGSGNQAADEGTKDQETQLPQTGADRALTIINFVRPLTLPQVKRMLSEFGEIEHFWMDSIKTHCYVVYKTVEMAQNAYSGTKGVVFPKETGKPLEPYFISAEDALRSTEEAEKAQNNRQRPNVFIGPTSEKPKADEASVNKSKAKEGVDTTAAASAASAAASASVSKDDAAQRRREEKKARQPQPQIVQPNELFQRTTTLPVLYFKALVDPPTKPAPAVSG